MLGVGARVGHEAEGPDARRLARGLGVKPLKVDVDEATLQLGHSGDDHVAALGGGLPDLGIGVDCHHRAVEILHQLRLEIAPKDVPRPLNPVGIAEALPRILDL